MKRLTPIFSLIFTLALVTNTNAQRQRKYPVHYEIFTNQAKTIKVHDAIVYKDRVGMRFPDGNLDYMYIDPNVHNIRRAYQDLPSLKVNQKGEADIKVRVRKSKEQLYNDAKRWIADAKKHNPNEKLLEKFYIKFHDIPEDRRGSVIKDNGFSKISYKGYSPRLFCTRERVCKGGVYVIDMKFNNGRYKLYYKGYPTVDVNDSLKSNEVQKIKFIKEFYDQEKRLYIFGLSAYSFQVNCISSSIYEYLSSRDTYTKYFRKIEGGRKENEIYMKDNKDPFVVESNANLYDEEPFTELEKVGGKDKNYGDAYKGTLQRKYYKESRRQLYEREKEAIAKKKKKKRRKKRKSRGGFSMDASY